MRMQMPTPTETPRRLSLGKVAAYIEAKHGFAVVRKTVYNWANVGVRGERLKTVVVGPRMWTAQKWVDDFLIRTTRR